MVFRKLQREIPFQEFEVLREENLVFQLSARAKCNADEVSGFRSPIPPHTLHDVGGYRDRGAAHLTDETIPFRGGEAFRGAVNPDHKLVCVPPDLELPVIPHADPYVSLIVYLAP
jgi:hypothetical protein